MATYTGDVASNGLPTPAIEATVDFAAMTLSRAQHVNLRKSTGSELTFGPAPGSHPDLPCYVEIIAINKVVVTPEVSTLDNSSAFIVSTTAVRLASANAARKSLLIVNAGGGSLYVDNTSAVASSGTSLGKLIGSSGGTYSDSGPGVSVGEVWGIYSTSASAQNVSVSDRS